MLATLTVGVWEEEEVSAILKGYPLPMTFIGISL